MNTLTSTTRTSTFRGGVTLVELLVTISILAILGSALMFAMVGATEAARRAKTRTMIATLHTLLMERYESYRTRRVPINTVGMDPNVAAAWRLAAIRQIIMIEMPERWTEVGDPSVPPSFQTALYHAYGRRKAGATSENQGAECLYMIITMATGEGEARSHFADSSIGDVDNDGAPEFLDGWGNPILFLRWPGGFTSSSELQTGLGAEDHDPFDPLRLIQGASRLVPLIVSAGPDELYDLLTDNATGNFIYPFLDPPLSFNGVNVEVHNQKPEGVHSAFDESEIGGEYDVDNDGYSPGDGEDNWIDNIHNHLIGLR